MIKFFVGIFLVSIITLASSKAQAEESKFKIKCNLSRQDSNSKKNTVELSDIVVVEDQNMIFVRKNDRKYGFMLKQIQSTRSFSAEYLGDYAIHVFMENRGKDFDKAWIGNPQDRILLTMSKSQKIVGAVISHSMIGSASPPWEHPVGHKKNEWLIECLNLQLSQP